MQFTPRANWVIVRLKEKEKTEGGIYVQGDAIDDRLAEIVEVGPGGKHDSGESWPIEGLAPGMTVRLGMSASQLKGEDPQWRAQGERRELDRDQGLYLVMDEEIPCIVHP